MRTSKELAEAIDIGLSEREKVSRQKRKRLGRNNVEVCGNLPLVHAFENHLFRIFEYKM